MFVWCILYVVPPFFVSQSFHLQGFKVKMIRDKKIKVSSSILLCIGGELTGGGFVGVGGWRNRHVTGDTRHVTHDIWHVTPLFCVCCESVLLSAHVERFSVSRKPDYLKIKCCTSLDTTVLMSAEYKRRKFSLWATLSMTIDFYDCISICVV